MKKLKSEIENGEFSKLYLFYGKEDFLKTHYRKLLEKNILDDGTSMMNYSLFTEKNFDLNNIIDACETMPFMSDYRMVYVENSGFFSAGKKELSSKLEEYIKDIPDTTILLFVEDEIDKRISVYKTANKIGRAVEMATPDTQDYVKWILRQFKESDIELERSQAMYLLEITNATMSYLHTEIQKLISFCGENKAITNKDIDMLVNKNVEVKIFGLIDAVGNGQKKLAFSIFHELINQKESPFAILALIERQLRLVLQCKVYTENNVGVNIIKSKLQLQEFVIKKCVSQGRNFTQERLINAIERSLETDVSIKTGLINEVVALEILIAEL